MEKISDNQIRFTLNKTDLVDREVRVSELAYGSEKAQELFKDMMDKAFEEFGFEGHNVPLMIEAVPLSSESIMIIVTKVDTPDELDQRLSNYNQAKNVRKFKNKNTLKQDRTVKQTRKNWTHVYSFDSLDNVIVSAVRIESLYLGSSSLYKDEKKKKYFLVLHFDPVKNETYEKIESILSEYGEQISSSDLAVGFISEHGELLIAKNAISICIDYLQ